MMWTELLSIQQFWKLIKYAQIDNSALTLYIFKFASFSTFMCILRCIHKNKQIKKQTKTSQIMSDVDILNCRQETNIIASSKDTVIKGQITLQKVFSLII